MSYMNYVIYKNKKHLRVFLEFCFNAGCTSNMQVHLAKPSGDQWPDQAATYRRPRLMDLKKALSWKVERVSEASMSIHTESKAKW